MSQVHPSDLLKILYFDVTRKMLGVNIQSLCSQGIWWCSCWCWFCFRFATFRSIFSISSLYFHKWRFSYFYRGCREGLVTTRQGGGPSSCDIPSASFCVKLENYVSWSVCVLACPVRLWCSRYILPFSIFVVLGKVRGV